jgi:hypothetical protein
MKIRSTLLTTLFVLLATTLASAQYTDADLQNIYMDMLSDEGIEGWIDSDGDVQFEYNDRSYFIGVSESDPEFFQLALWNIWPIESNSEAIEVLFAVDAVNREKKVVKAYSNDDNVWIAVEMFVDSPRDAAPMFMRSLEVIESAVDLFVEEM